jgi:hypothetical protein
MRLSRSTNWQCYCTKVTLLPLYHLSQSPLFQFTIYTFYYLSHSSIRFALLAFLYPMLLGIDFCFHFLLVGSSHFYKTSIDFLICISILLFLQLSKIYLLLGRLKSNGWLWNLFLFLFFIFLASQIYFIWVLKQCNRFYKHQWIDEIF